VYEKFFALAHRPFAAAPNLECIVAHEGYVQARERLLRCLTDGCGTGVLTAPAGLGKSLLCQDIQCRLRGMFTVAYLCSAQFPNRKAMLQAILFELGAEYLGLSEDEARLCVLQAAQEAAARGRSLIIIVDEAHLVSTELLQELRSLAEPSTRCTNPARLMLAGQLELEERLADPALDSLNQRIACHAILESLTQSESAEYIHERLAISGAKTQAFTEEALAFIVKAADGNPRALHQLCDHCLLSAYTIEEKPVSLETARNSLDDLKALPLHWNDAGLLDDSSDPIDDSMEELGDDDFVSTVSPLAEEQDAAGSREAEVQSDFTDEPAPLWGDSADLGVIEIGGSALSNEVQPEAQLVEPVVAAPAAELESAVPEYSEAALFASVAPWPAVPVEAIGAAFGENITIDMDDAPAEDTGSNADVQIETEPSIVSFSTISEATLNSSTAECSAAGDTEVEDVESAHTPDDDGFTLHDPGSVNFDLVADLDESEEDTAIEQAWSKHVEFLDDLETDDFDDEELVINDRYAALDRASESLSGCFPKAPELLQFLSQYAAGDQPRRGHDAPAAMHQSAAVAEPETDTHEEELLATIRGLQEQLRQATTERPRPTKAAEPWQESVQPMQFDIVEPPEAPAAQEPVAESSAAHREHAPEPDGMPVPVAVKSEPVKSRFAQLFSRMRQRRREVEDRLRKNADWI